MINIDYTQRLLLHYITIIHKGNLLHSGQCHLWCLVVQILRIQIQVQLQKTRVCCSFPWNSLSFPQFSFHYNNHHRLSMNLMKQLPVYLRQVFWILKPLLEHTVQPTMMEYCPVQFPYPQNQTNTYKESNLEIIADIARICFRDQKEQGS